MTTIIADLRGNSEFAGRQWDQYVKAVRRIGDTKSLQEANEGLGYNLVKTIPGLLQWIQELQETNTQLSKELYLLRAQGQEPMGSVDMPDPKRPLGIPAGHIILDIAGTPTPSVGTKPGATLAWLADHADEALEALKKEN